MSRPHWDNGHLARWERKLSKRVPVKWGQLILKSPRFYLHYVEPRRKTIEKGLFKFASLGQLKGWDVMLGLQFENLVLNHVEDLFPLLGLSRSLVLFAAAFIASGAPKHVSAKRFAGIPLYVTVGSRERTADYLADFTSEIKDAGGTVEFDILSGCRHPEACSKAFTAKKLNWIFSQRKTRRAGK